jgi:hypothetical protein
MPIPEPKLMTKAEFKEFVEENLWPWLSNSPRTLESHLLGLEEWATREYNKAYKEFEKLQKQDKKD